MRLVGVGRIRSVDLERYVCTVAIEYPEFQVVTDVAFSTDYASMKNSSFEGHIPQKDCRVRVDELEFGQFVIGKYLTVPGNISFKPDFKGFREDLNPGDWCMSKDYGNKIVVRNNGVIQIQTSPVCRTEFTPSKNKIFSFCDNFQLQTFGGDLSWYRDSNTQAADFVLRMKSECKKGFPEDIVLSMGSSAGLLSLNIGPDKCKIHIGKDGAITIEAQENITVTTPKSVNVIASTSAKVTTQAATIDAPNTTITGNLSVGGSISSGGSISAGGSFSTGGNITAAGSNPNHHGHP